MSACQANPLTQFISKGEQHPRYVHKLGHENSSNHFVPHLTAPDDAFLYGQDVTAGNRFMSGMYPGPTPMTAAVQGLPKIQQQPETQRHLMGQNSSNNTSWLSQFHSMKIEDPLEFPQDYKKMYSAYDRQTPMIRFPMTACRPSYNHPPRDVSKEQGPRECKDVFTSEFEALERELEEVENKRMPAFDQEQVEFQKIANDIVESCSSGQPATKLRSSKFMGLMKGISEGSVTLNKEESENATELHSPYTGQRVGNEYFPVEDHTLHYE